MEVGRTAETSPNLLARARRALKADDDASALPLLDRVLATEANPSERVLPLRLRTRASARVGDLRTAVADAIEVLAIEPAQPEGFIEALVQRLRQLGEWDQAVTVLDAHASRYPDLADRLSAWRQAADTDQRVVVGFTTGRGPDDETEVLDVSSSEPVVATADALVQLDVGLAERPGDVEVRWQRLRCATALNDDASRLTLSTDVDHLIRRVTSVEEGRDLQAALVRLGRTREAVAMSAWVGESMTDSSSSPTPQRSSSSMPLLYTVLTGGYEAPHDASHVVDDPADFVILTDRPDDLPEHMQQYARHLSVDGDPQLASRRPKMLPHEYFPDRRYSMYVDANFFFLRDPRPLADRIDEGEPMLVLHHSNRKSPAEEMIAVVERGYATHAEVVERMQHQRDAGFDPFEPTLSYGGFLVRDHQSAAVRSAMEIWWREFQGGIRRDQTSLDFSLWQAGLRPRRLSMDNHRNEYWIRMTHV